MPSRLHIAINHSKEPIRLFQSDLLEFFTHIHPIVVLAIWVPVVLYFFAVAIVQQSTSETTTGIYIPLAFLLGLFLWTFAEYTLHRFVFHFRPRTQWQERLAFLFHGVHHAQPKQKTRLVMPPAVSIPLAVLFYAVFYLALGQALSAPHWIAPAFAGFISGYLIYDMTHYATHHRRMRRRVFKFLKRHHMQHHYKTPDQRYGVSSPLWDIVFGTLPGGA